MQSSLKENIAGVRSVYGHVAHGARLVLGCLVMRRSVRTLRRKRVALQAQHIDLAYAQETRVRGTMWRMASCAAFRFYRHMLVHKRSAGIGMALHASGIAAGQSLGLAERGCAVNVVAIAAMNQSFIYAMVIWPGKLSFGIGVA